MNIYIYIHYIYIYFNVFYVYQYIYKKIYILSTAYNRTVGMS